MGERDTTVQILSEWTDIWSIRSSIRARIPRTPFLDRSVKSAYNIDHKAICRKIDIIWS